MKRQLPIVEILGTAFYVDVQRDELREKANANNQIPFSVFDQEGDGYTFLYDVQRKSIPEDTTVINELGTRYQWVTLPALMELDPEGIALKYDIPLEILCPERLLRGTDDDDDEEEEYDAFG
ncbi:hypothetical protein VRU48_14905 [Pedobacter sp. KR3-3]|uniref:Uncharacterized protein n=1 Tax=Pedobacter albus TaxID=3113905 RepID=A0ABU7IAC0_9SPHI|nr:hypothetical protein [Pedobacter sp. KR3-3]MEE1946411.1 hypothetical protein [Pedobacter sp. KR3-3]